MADLIGHSHRHYHHQWLPDMIYMSCGENHCAMLNFSFPGDGFYRLRIAGFFIIGTFYMDEKVTWNPLNCLFTEQTTSTGKNRPQTVVQSTIMWLSVNKKLSYRKDSMRCMKQPFKVICCCANWRGIFDFLLAPNSNFTSIVKCFWDIMFSLYHV